MTRWTPGRSRLASVIAGSLTLYGCVAQPVSLEPERPRGYIAARAGRVGAVVAAPHGSSDVNTGEIAADLARRTGFGLVIASGFALEPDTRERPGRRFQVNRPFEGVPGRPPGEEAATPAARRVYDAYEQRVLDVARGPLVFYAELHGNNRRDTADRIEIATVGVDREDAQRLRTLLELIRDAHLGAHAGAPRLTVLVEPADPVFYAASGAKRDGILRLPARALHIELPRAARAEWRELYTGILADFLGQAYALGSRR
jgi:hypothetical protein